MVTRSFRISKDLQLPLESVTETFAILAKRGAGKTYTGSVMAEEMLRANQQIVVVDPTGAWWGLRASADGKGEGFPITILGGEHADLPLEPTMGEVVADLVVNKGVSIIVDLKGWRKGEQIQFMLDFAETLYRKNREPLHIFVDEADMFAPQKPLPEQYRLLGAIEDLVRRGRGNGIGLTLITQRAAVLNKNVLTQAEVLIALRTTGPQDVNAVDEWIKHHGEQDKREKVLQSLAGLPLGTAWIWSPGFLGLFKQIQVRQRTTFNSSATPKVGERIAKPKVVAQVDLERLRDEFAEVIKKRKETDPKQLRRQIAELQKQLAAKPLPSATPRVVEVPVISDRTVQRLEQVYTGLGKFTERVEALRDDIGKALGVAKRGVPSSSPSGTQRRPERNGPLPVHPPPVPPPAPRPLPGDPEDDEAGLGNPKTGKYRMAQVLVQRHPIKLTRSQLGTLAGLQPSSGTFSTYLSALRTGGFIIEEGDHIVATQKAFDAIGADVPPAPQTTEELVKMWKKNIGEDTGAARMLDALVEKYPEGFTRTDLAQAAGLTGNTGTFSTYLSTLRRNDLIKEQGEMVIASDALFLDGR